MKSICKIIVPVVLSFLLLSQTHSVALDSYWWGYTEHVLTDEQRDLVERVVAAEARGTSYDCMLAVTQTIRERREHWGTSIEEILEYPQYAKPYQGDISDDVKQAVSDVFDNGVRQFAEYTTHFHSASVSPYWTKNKQKRGEFDGVIFWGADIQKEGT